MKLEQLLRIPSSLSPSIPIILGNSSVHGDNVSVLDLKTMERAALELNQVRFLVARGEQSIYLRDLNPVCKIVGAFTILENRIRR